MVQSDDVGVRGERLVDRRLEHNSQPKARFAKEDSQHGPGIRTKEWRGGRRWRGKRWRADLKHLDLEALVTEVVLA